MAGIKHDKRSQVPGIDLRGNARRRFGDGDFAVQGNLPQKTLAIGRNEIQDQPRRGPIRGVEGKGLVDFGGLGEIEDHARAARHHQTEAEGLDEAAAAVARVRRQLKAIIEVSKFTGVPESEIYGVATFYTQFRFSPVGKKHIMVCKGTACHVKGSTQIIEGIERHLGIKEGEVTFDLEYSLESVGCLGCCALAPCAMINGEVESNLYIKGC